MKRGNHDECLAHLRRCFLFREIEPEALAAVAECVDEVHHQSGTCLVAEGSSGNAFYIIRAGVVRITKQMPDGHKVIVAELSAGEVFGEMALITGAPRSSDCVVLEDVSLFELTRKRFEALERTQPYVYTTIVRTIGTMLCTRLATMTNEVASLLRELRHVERSISSAEEQATKAKSGFLGFLKTLGGRGESRARQGGAP